MITDEIAKMSKEELFAHSERLRSGMHSPFGDDECPYVNAYIENYYGPEAYEEQKRLIEKEKRLIEMLKELKDTFKGNKFYRSLYRQRKYLTDRQRQCVEKNYSQYINSEPNKSEKQWES